MRRGAAKAVMAAHSAAQVQKLLRTIQGAVLGLRAPGEPFAALMPCTVVAEGDLADRILDRKQHPEWHGARSSLVVEWPENRKLWDEYHEIRAECQRRGLRGHEEDHLHEVAFSR